MTKFREILDRVDVSQLSNVSTHASYLIASLIHLFSTLLNNFFLTIRQVEFSHIRYYLLLSTRGRKTSFTFAAHDWTLWRLLLSRNIYSRVTQYILTSHKYWASQLLYCIWLHKKKDYKYQLSEFRKKLLAE